MFVCVCVCACVCVRKYIPVSEGMGERERGAWLLNKRHSGTVFLALYVQCKNNMHFVSIWTVLPGRGCAQ